MNVLIACEESQIECIAFRNAGFNAFSCDIKLCSGGHPEWHIYGDVSFLLSSNVDFITEDFKLHHIDKWDLIIAHPPCTYLSRAATGSLYKNSILNKDRYIEGLKARDFFMKFYYYGLYTNTHLCIENPIPFKIFELPDVSQYVQPYEFGDPFSKKTCFWLFNLPLLKSTNVVSALCSYTDTCHGSELRSKSFPGISAAMAKQWGDYIKEYIE